ncbi:MAG: FeoB-associated Cys-rich membrane protein [Desulfobacterales bacterium]
MIWEYLILAAALAWAVFYLWRSLFRKKGCSCESCPSANNDACQSNEPGCLNRQEEKPGNAADSRK